MADVKWIKLSVGLPDNKKIKQIRRLPEGDTIALMWIFLMCLAGETNENGMVYFTPEIPYTDEMLADHFNMDIGIVRVALQTFQRFGMLEIIDNIIYLDSWEKYQNIEGMDKIREQNRLRKQRQRERQKQLPMSRDSHGTVTECHGTDKDIEEDKDIKNKYIYIVDYLNQKAGTKYKSSSKKTQTCIHARLAEGFTEDDFKVVIDKKCAEWLGTEFEQYLRPETLFGTKFESYLNAKVTKKQNKGVPEGSAQDDLDDLF